MRCFDGIGWRSVVHEFIALALRTILLNRMKEADMLKNHKNRSGLEN